MSKAVDAVPAGMHSVTPHLVCDGAGAAIDFYVKAFGAADQGRMPGPDGRLMHAQIRIGDSYVMLVDENRQFGMLGPKSLNGSPVTIHLYVDDVDRSFERAVAAGATSVMPPADMFWGDRYGVLEDPFGHRWSIATHQREVSADEMQQAIKAFDPKCGT
ncbi:MAG TPA: VOC family protein [Steroidobacteraceae bacterium]|jgi:PhnB protein|nr:VOC family protein [Steroidobacteraceae bacterium]